MSTSNKQNIGIFLLKDMKQYKLDYFNTINYMVGKNWPLGNKKILFNNLKLIKIFKYFFHTIFIYKLYLILIV